VLRRYGNMSSPTIFFVLREMLRNPDVHGEGIALAFGPGLTVEAARLVKE
jgi:predicted naringenin-chalcone synthase